MAFVVFEGLDGSGKSTLIEGLRDHLQKAGLSTKVTREPGGTPLGEELRRLLLTTDGDAPTPRCELLLYQAIRAQHVERLIQPALNQGVWVLCDRFTASSVAFQAGARGLGRTDVDWLNGFSTHNLRPDLTVLLDLTVEQAMERLKARYNDKQNEDLDRFEQEEKGFHERVRQTYLDLAKGQKNWLILDSSRPPDELLSELISHLRSQRWIP